MMDRLFAIAAVLALLLASMVSVHATTYTVTELGAIGMPLGINDLGQVISQKGYVWQNGVVQNLGAIPGVLQGRFNNRGQVLAVDASSGTERSYICQNGVTQDLGSLPGYDRIIARSLNNLGQVVGIALNSATNMQQAFLWENGVMQPIDPRPGTSWGNRAYDINNLGQIVVYDRLGGYILNSDNGATQEVDEVPPGFEWGMPGSINDLGQVVGCGQRTESINTTNIQGYIWENGVAQDLGSLPGWEFIQAFKINNKGQVLGYAYTSNPSADPEWDGKEYQFLWQNGVMQEISTALGELGPVSVSDINNLGQMVGVDSMGRAVLWTPVPEPSSILALFGGLVGIGGFAFRRRRI
jgi:probable HAF family extracellular repeat protein